jgi:flagellar biosynthesis/type III secretory pathway protein FliH
MFFPDHIIKHARATQWPTPEQEAEPPAYVGGIIRDAQTRMQAEPYAVDGPNWTSDVPLPAQPSAVPEPEPAPVDVDALRAEWEAEWKAQAAAEREAAVAAAREEAYAEGAAAAREELAAEYEAERAALVADAARLRALWEEHLADADPHLVGLAVDVAEAVLDGTIGSETHAATAAAITGAVEHLAARPPLVVTLHPVDHLRLQEAGLVDALSVSHPDLRWVPDPALAEGDWALDANGAAIRRIRAEVLHDLRVRLGLLAPAADAAPAALSEPVDR